jgi:acyl-CoA thioester hydrolase
MSYRKKIYYHDTDCGGVVYYANYLKYLEEARTEYLSGKKVSLKELTKQGILFVVRDMKIAYKAPARYADTVEISTKIEKIKSASLLFQQEARRGSELLVTADTTLVCIGKDFSPIPIPEQVVQVL